MGRASLDMSLTFIRIIISCEKTNNRAVFTSSPTKLVSTLGHGSCSSLTTSRCSLLLKSKAGRMDLNLFRISLCLVMSVARMHLRDKQSGGVVETLRQRGEANTQAGGKSHLMIPSLIRLYWSTARFLKMLLSAWKAAECFLIGCLVQKLKLTTTLVLPSPESQRLRHSGGSPVERCRCSVALAQFGHLSGEKKQTNKQK